MNLAVRVLAVLLLCGALLTPVLRWRRLAFAGLVALGLSSFALRAGWPARPLAARACELVVGPALALHSFRNTPHILLSAVCFLPRARSSGRRAPTAARDGGPTLALS